MWNCFVKIIKKASIFRPLIVNTLWPSDAFWTILYQHFSDFSLCQYILCCTSYLISTICCPEGVNQSRHLTPVLHVVQQWCVKNPAVWQWGRRFSTNSSRVFLLSYMSNRMTSLRRCHICFTPTVRLRSHNEMDIFHVAMRCCQLAKLSKPWLLTLNQLCFNDLEYFWYRLCEIYSHISLSTLCIG